MMPSATKLGINMTLTPPLLTLLRLMPLLSTTASLTHAYMEFVTTSSFLSPAPTTSSLSKSMLRGEEPTSSPQNAAELAAAKEIVIPAWFVNFFNRGVWSVVGLNSITLASAGVNLWVFQEGLGLSRRYYLTGFVAAAAHYAFVPLVGESVTRLFVMCAGREKGRKGGRKGKLPLIAVQDLQEWIGFHKVRMCSVDVVAWVSFMVGVVNMLTR
ncbi:hypothetical protein HBI56_226850 [Parastagonospora nodorum]|nr:hypothetical protein HBH53_233900 [Parastagonospora nodorum]KAH3958991.1 hypothetical protein HBH51_202570 [Parastagonospora nodorum]KAH3963603.1 hypothetical protein HBH52_216620 [Parastagonospora nodorum]KAH3991145.1 hypothetical protein HBI10_237660 [Parastagonospora nodorum]KAH4008446.1 hypothetical protein HBI13_236190 [Parastagonospora nodorum]